MLPNNNTLIYQGEGGYHSEFTPDRECVLKAKFMSNLFSTYQGYKFDLIRTPAKYPVLKCYVPNVTSDVSHRRR